MAVAKIGDKTMIVYYTDKDEGVKCSVQIHDKNSRVYYVHVKDGKVVERCVDNANSQKEIDAFDLKVYVPVFYTLPEKLKDAIACLL
jgi:hypothetical protein